MKVRMAQFKSVIAVIVKCSQSDTFLIVKYNHDCGNSFKYRNNFHCPRCITFTTLNSINYIFLDQICGQN